MKKLKLLTKRERLTGLMALIFTIASVAACFLLPENKYAIVASALVACAFLVMLCLSFINRIAALNHLSAEVDNGHLPDIDKKIKHTLATKKIVRLYHKIQEIIAFVKAPDEHDRQFKYLDEKGRIGSMLNELATRQKDYKENEQKRIWKSESLSKFAEILQVSDQDLKDLSMTIISSLVKQLEASQGAFFIKDNEGETEFMDLIACYAYDRKKKVKTRILPGEGLLGQVMLEKDLIFLTDVPDDFLNIRSGMGGASPKNVIIVPLVANDKYYGAIELASFNILEDYKVEYLKSLAQNIAVTIATLKNNEHTRNLLKESQKMAQELSSREEEMRQNMEELETTQEEMSRGKIELDGIFNALSNSQGLVEFNLSGEILLVNEELTEMLGYSEAELKNNAKILLPEKDQKQFWERLSRKENVEIELLASSKKGKKTWLNINYSPIEDGVGNVIKVLTLVLDITKRKNKEIEFERLSLVADNTHNSVIIADKDGLVEYVNNGFVKLSGYTLEEIRGKKPGTVLQGPDTDAEVVKKIGEKIRLREPLYEEILNYDKSGSSYWISLTINPVFDTEGNLEKFISIQANITDTKKKSLDYNYQLQAINRSNAVIEFDTSGHILRANDNFLRIFGYTEEEVVGKHHRIFVDPKEHDSEDYQNLWKTLGRGEHVNQEFKRINKKGEVVYLQGIYNPIFDIRNEPTKIVKFARDITLEKQLQIETELQQKEINSHLDTINTTLASIEFDMTGKINKVNKVYLDVSGYEKKELVGKKYEYLLSEEEKNKPQTEMMWSSLKAGNSFTGQFSHKSKSSEAMHLSGTFKPLINGEGKSVKIMMFAQFNTQYIEKKEELSQTLNAFKNALPILELDFELVFKTANKMFFEHFGYSRMDLRKKPFAFLLNSKKNQWKKDEVQTSLIDNDFLKKELHFVTNTGEEKSFITTFSMIKNANPAKSKVLVVLTVINSGLDKNDN